MRMVNVNGESTVNGGKCTMERTSPWPHTVTVSVHVTRASNIFFSYIIDKGKRANLTRGDHRDSLVVISNTNCVVFVTFGPGRDERRLES